MKSFLPKLKKLLKIHLRRKHLLWLIFPTTVLGLALGLTFLAQQNQITARLNTEWEQKLAKIEKDRDQLAVENNALSEAYEKVATNEAIMKNTQWEETLSVYQALQEKFDEYGRKGVKTETIKPLLMETVDLLLDRRYEECRRTANQANEKLDELMAVKIEADKKAAEQAAQSAASSTANYSSQPGNGYSRISVATERGSFVVDVIMVDLGQVRVITSTANDNDCGNDCPTKPLANHVADNGGFAGINGTYFCPPDYASCAGKINSFDFPVWRTASSKWINGGNLFWNDRAMVWFDGGSTPHFCPNANSCGTGGIAAGIVNHPALVVGGNSIVNEGALPDSLRSVKGYRGAIGFSDNWLYLLVIRGASVPDVAYVMKAMGIQNGMNLDGGGSSALYYNGYRVGPGRSLPNAVVIASK